MNKTTKSQAILPDKLKDFSPREWVKILKTPIKKQSRLTLSRAGEEVYISSLLEAKLNRNKELVFTVDTLLPQLKIKSDDEIVLLHGKIVYMDMGFEVTYSFRAKVGEKTEFKGFEALVLEDIKDLRLESNEYIADITDIHPMVLALFFEERWNEVYPERISVSRIFFDADLELDITPDGLFFPKSLLTLTPGEPEALLSLLLFRRIKPEFEAKIEKIESKEHLRLCEIIEEIWNIESGLSQRRDQYRERVGFRSREHDILADSLREHILFIGNDSIWPEWLTEFGIVKTLATTDHSEIIDELTGKRCDLIVADADYFGLKTISTERKLRDLKKIKDIPRFWIMELKSSENVSENDLVDYGAFEMLNRTTWNKPAKSKIEWALKRPENDFVPSAPLLKTTLILLTDNPRIRYRIGAGLIEKGIEVVSASDFHGLIPYLEKMNLSRAIIDLSSKLFNSQQLIESLLNFCEGGKGKLMILLRSANKDDIVKWANMGIKDIVVMDASLRNAASRAVEFARSAVNE